MADPAAEAASPFENKFLLSLPALRDGFFNKSLVYICAHGAEGTMGLIINQSLPGVEFTDLLEKLGVPSSTIHIPALSPPPVIHFGGPVQPDRGFVLHSPDFSDPETMPLNNHLSLTGSLDVLRAMTKGKGPARSLILMGHASWGPGQLEREIKDSAWITAPMDPELIFSPDLDTKWARVMARLNINPGTISLSGGTA